MVIQTSLGFWFFCLFEKLIVLKGFLDFKRMQKICKEYVFLNFTKFWYKNTFCAFLKFFLIFDLDFVNRKCTNLVSLLIYKYFCDFFFFFSNVYLVESDMWHYLKT